MGVGYVLGFVVLEVVFDIFGVVIDFCDCGFELFIGDVEFFCLVV